MEATDASRLVCVVVVSYQEFNKKKLSRTAHRFDTGTKRGTACDGPLEGAVVLMEVGTIGGTVESASTVVLAGEES